MFGHGLGLFGLSMLYIDFGIISSQKQNNESQLEIVSSCVLRKRYEKPRKDLVLSVIFVCVGAKKESLYHPFYGDGTEILCFYMDFQNSTLPVQVSLITQQAARSSGLTQSCISVIQVRFFSALNAAFACSISSAVFASIA